MMTKRMMTNYTQHFDLAAKSAIEAGKEILKVYATDFDVEKKADDSPLTRADMAAHNIISAALKKTSLPLLSEEGSKISYDERKKWETFWLVDPLDGTKEFVKRNGEFTVNIALIHMQQAVMGVVYAPVLDVMYFGSMYSGAYRLEKVTEKKISGFTFEELSKLSENMPLHKKREKYTVVASRSHLSNETKAFIDELTRQKQGIETISRGSSLKLCMIAEGSADVYPRFAPTMEWDTAAGHAVVISAGGRVTKKDKNEPLLYNKEELLNPWFIAFGG